MCEDGQAVMVVAKLATTNYGTPSPKARPMFNLLRLTDGMATVALWRDVATLEDPLLCVPGWRKAVRASLSSTLTRSSRT